MNSDPNPQPALFDGRIRIRFRLSHRSRIRVNSPLIRRPGTWSVWVTYTNIQFVAVFSFEIRNLALKFHHSKNVLSPLGCPPRLVQTFHIDICLCFDLKVRVSLA